MFHSWHMESSAGSSDLLLIGGHFHKMLRMLT